MDGLVETQSTAKGMQRRSNNRRPAILDAAALQFRHQGYAATTMRDIARDAGMLAGSLYYHFPSKSELLLAVHQEGVRRIADAVDQAINSNDANVEPWLRLEHGLIAHLESLLSGGDYAQVVIRDLPIDDPALKAKLVALRDSYEDRFRELIDALPLAEPGDAHWIRLMLLGAANCSKMWFRADGASPAEIGKNFIRMIRASNAMEIRS